ncbi:MAG: hypothetical protein AAGG07_01190 [Planctomycetota bacterium]
MFSLDLSVASPNRLRDPFIGGYPITYALGVDLAQKSEGLLALRATRVAEHPGRIAHQTADIHYTATVSGKLPILNSWGVAIDRRVELWASHRLQPVIDPSHPDGYSLIESVWIYGTTKGDAFPAHMLKISSDYPQAPAPYARSQNPLGIFFYYAPCLRVPLAPLPDFKNYPARSRKPRTVRELSNNKPNSSVNRDFTATLVLDRSEGVQP